MLLLAHCFLLWHIPLLNFWSRSSRPEVFSKKAVLRNFAKFTGKRLCPSLFFHKVAGLRPPTLLKKRLGHGCFSMNFAKLLRIPLFMEHLRWLLLLIPFWITVVEIFCLKFDFLLHTEIHTPKDTNDEIKTNRNAFSLLSDVDVEESMFF